MANETAAWGTVTIYAPSKDALEDFIYLKILSEKHATYTTEFSDFPPYATPTEDEISYEKMIQTLYREHDVYMEKDGSYSVNLALCGVGRWTFGQNVRWFFSYPFEGFEYISYSHDLYEVAWNNGETDFKEKNIKYERILPHHEEFSIGQYD